MDDKLPLLLENLGRYHRARLEAEEREQRQIEACVQAGYDSPTIARVLKCRPNNVRAMRAWRERPR